MPDAGFGTADFTILSVSLIIFGAFGIYYILQSRKPKADGEKGDISRTFLIDAKPSAPVFVNAITLFGTYITANSIIGNPSAVYTRTTTYWLSCLPLFYVIPFVNFLVLPVFFDLSLSSSWEYLGLRFNQHIRLISFAINSVQNIFIMGFNLYAPAIVFARIARIDFFYCISVVGIVCVGYTSFGGIKAVLWTQGLQVFIMVVSSMVIFFMGTDDWRSGGFKNVTQFAMDKGVINIWDWDPGFLDDKYTFWSSMVKGTFSWLISFSYNQDVLTRYICMSDKSSARKVLWLQIPLIVPFLTFLAYGGIVLSKFYENCDPYIGNRILDREEMMAVFADDLFDDTDGLKGLYVAGVLSSSLSTISSKLNSLAFNIYNDILEVYFRRLGEAGELLCVKILSVIGGIMVIIVAAATLAWRSGLRSSNVFSACLGGPVLGVFCLGLFIPRVHTKHCMVGLISGLIFGLYMLVNHYVHEPPAWRRDLYYQPIECEQVKMLGSRNTSIYNRAVRRYPHFEDLPFFMRVGYLYFAAVAFFVTFITAILASYWIDTDEDDIPMPSAYFAPMFRDKQADNFERQPSIGGIPKSPLSVDQRMVSNPDILSPATNLRMRRASRDSTARLRDLTRSMGTSFSIPDSIFTRTQSMKDR